MMTVIDPETFNPTADSQREVSVKKDVKAGRRKLGLDNNTL